MVSATSGCPSPWLPKTSGRACSTPWAGRAWAYDGRFRSQYRRQRHRRELDALLSQWTAQRDADAITDLLQQHGVAAAPVLSAEERLFHPHLMESADCIGTLTIPALGAEPIFNLMWNLSKTPSAVRRHAPLMGEHNRDRCCAASWD